MIKPQPQGQLGDAPVVVAQCYQITVELVQLRECDGRVYDTKANDYVPTRIVEEVKSDTPEYRTEQAERPAFTFIPTA